MHHLEILASNFHSKRPRIVEKNLIVHDLHSTRMGNQNGIVEKCQFPVIYKDNIFLDYKISDCTESAIVMCKKEYLRRFSKTVIYIISRPKYFTNLIHSVDFLLISVLNIDI